MTSVENSPIPPVRRARDELTKAAILAMDLDVITKDELGALVVHLGLSDEARKLSHAKRNKIDKYLATIGEKIIAREAYLENRRFVAKQLAVTGLLAAAVGREGTSPMSRQELLALEVIDERVAQHPRVDRNVFVDLSVANDLAWLHMPTRPSKAAQRQQGDTS